MALKLFGTLFAGKKAGKEVNAPIIFGDIINHDLSSDFTATAGQLDKGVFFKGDAEGAYTCVTFAQYMDNGGDVATDASERAAAIAAAIAASDTVDLYLAGYQWSDTAVVFIDATGAPSTNINIGLY